MPSDEFRQDFADQLKRVARNTDALKTTATALNLAEFKVEHFAPVFPVIAKLPTIVPRACAIANLRTTPADFKSWLMLTRQLTNVKRTQGNKTWQKEIILHVATFLVLFPNRRPIEQVYDFFVWVKPAVSESSLASSNSAAVPSHLEGKQDSAIPSAVVVKPKNLTLT